MVALLHELVGIEVVRGLKFFATSSNDRYDSLFCCVYNDDSLLFLREGNRLGVSRDLPRPYTSEPKVLEYKYDFEALIGDFEKEEKYAKHVDLVVCWQASKGYREKFFLNSLLVGDEGTSRHFFGSTHQAYPIGGQNAEFEVMILDDLLKYIADPVGEEARQKAEYNT